MAEAIMTMGIKSTIQDYIAEFNNEEVVSSAFFLKQVFSSANNRKMLLNFENLIVKYMPELKNIKTKVTLSNPEYAKYKFNPKVLSYDIYGTTELWFLILEANELHSITEFNSNVIYLYNPEIIDKLIRILNLEVDSKNYNAEEVSTSLIS